MSQVIINCFECGEKMEFEATGIISRRDECPKCGADVRACKNCRFYDAKVYNECKETQAEVVKEKDRSNFCDFFEAGSGEGGNKSKEDLLAAAEAIFKK